MSSGKSRNRKGTDKRKLLFLHEIINKSVEKGKDSVIYEEEIRQYAKDKGGIQFKLFKKKGDKIEKYVGKETPKGTFNFYVVKDNKKDEQELTFEDLKKVVKNIKGLEFVVKFLKTVKLSSLGKIGRIIRSKRKSKSKSKRKRKSKSKRKRKSKSKRKRK
uniref:Uncharacterized protein n=1 Tax=Mimivirus LCMiAC02 TaxID=2506609 RepID=A0A481Z0E7_9VIRU|nr:MAG: uncharacterized protein LCMiAC02_00760 [Mimivirus LCMiAC02]